MLALILLAPPRSARWRAAEKRALKENNHVDRGREVDLLLLQLNILYLHVIVVIVIISLNFVSVEDYR